MKIFTLILQQCHLLIREPTIMVPIASRYTNYRVYILPNPRNQCLIYVCKCDLYFYFILHNMNGMHKKVDCPAFRNSIVWQTEFLILRFTIQEPNVDVFANVNCICAFA
jgi:hypothetical protein